MLEYLSHYHSCVSPKVEILRPAVMLNEINRKLRGNRKRGRRNVKQFQHNIFEGALHYPAFGLSVQTDAMDNYWLTDLLALGESPADGTPSVLHGLFSTECAAGAMTYMCTK